MKTPSKMDVAEICDKIKDPRRYRVVLLFGDHDRKTTKKILEIGDRLDAKVINVLDEVLQNLDPPLGAYGEKHFIDFVAKTSQIERRPLILHDVEPLLSTFFGGKKEVIRMFTKLSASDLPKYPVVVVLKSAVIKNAIAFDPERVFQL